MNEIFPHLVLINHITTTSPSPTHSLSLPVPVPDVIDAYVNASKTVLKQGEPLTVNCTAHGGMIVYFSWDIPNREVSRSGSEQELLFSFPFMITLRPPDRAQITSRWRDTPRFLSPCLILLITCGVCIVIIASFRLIFWIVMNEVSEKLQLFIFRFLLRLMLHKVAEKLELY